MFHLTLKAFGAQQTGEAASGQAVFFGLLSA
jgi:hypothetical protein